MSIVPHVTVEVEKHLLKEQINYIESASWCAVPLSVVACMLLGYARH
jgi:hypothetical protein